MFWSSAKSFVYQLDDQDSLDEEEELEEGADLEFKVAGISPLKGLKHFKYTKVQLYCLIS